MGGVFKKGVSSIIALLMGLKLTKGWAAQMANASQTQTLGASFSATYTDN